MTQNNRRLLDVDIPAQPDVLVKGSDYSLDGVIGRELVESWGGQVRLADFVDGHSTTATISKLAKRA